MDKNFIDVVIDGKVYTLGGEVEGEYLQRVATYINGKLGELRQTKGFSRQNADYQHVLLSLNMADDYFGALEENRQLKESLTKMENELYHFKHDLVETQIKLEAAEKEGKEWRDALELHEAKLNQLKDSLQRKSTGKQDDQA